METINKISNKLPKKKTPEKMDVYDLAEERTIEFLKKSFSAPLV